MSSINLRYGKTFTKFEFDPEKYSILGESTSHLPLTDVEIGERFDAPVNSQKIEEIIGPGETVLFVVPDATRQTACGQVINLLIRRLIANGTMPFDIRIIFATGIHRKVSDEEKLDIVTPFIAQRTKMLDHNPRDLAQIVRFGETSGGIPIELNRAVAEHDHTVIIGGINFHYFAGFTGGRKLICPGLGSTRTISETHKLAFDFDRMARREGVGAAKLDGNAVNEAFEEIVEKFPPSFAVNTIVDDHGAAIEIFAGNWKTSHRKACDYYAEHHTKKVGEKRAIVIASCGGFPHDINLIQAHKALDAAANACKDGGTIILLAECENGLGKSDFLDWFEAENSDSLAERLSENYQVNGQTAWSLLKKAERFNIRIISSLAETETRRMRLQPAPDLENALAEISVNEKGYILPYGAKFLINA